MINIDNNTIVALIKSAELEYQSDTSWLYTAETQFLRVAFLQDEDGTNLIIECCYKQKGEWMDIMTTDEQNKLMFQILNDTPYREVEVDAERIADYYDYYGVQRENFY